MGVSKPSLFEFDPATPIRKWLGCRIHDMHDEIFAWYEAQREKSPLPFYCSLDLRDAGYKIAPVDCNLYPAGFNNICGKDMDVAPKIFKENILATAARFKVPNPRKVLILPESHTQNTYYIENVYYLAQLLDIAGFETVVGWDNSAQSLKDPLELKSMSGNIVKAYPLLIQNGKATTVTGFTPDLILLNNDYSGGYPTYLDQVSQPIVPSFKAGWHSRKKGDHFLYYNQLAQEFCNLISFDPWFIQVASETIDQVNFNESIGVDRAAQAVEKILSHARKKYAEYKIDQEPFAFIKSSTGTYGMGIMVVRSAEELLAINRREKNKMSVGKNRSTIESVVVQEGIPTSTVIDGLAGEPVIYMVGRDLVGGFVRANTERGKEENLNSKGMIFKPLCMSDLRKPFEQPTEPKKECMLEHVYGSIARLSALAAGKELSRLVPIR